MRLAGIEDWIPERTSYQPEPIDAVLFDFSSTLFRAVDEHAWLRRVLAAERGPVDDRTIESLVAKLHEAWELAEVVAAQNGRDLSEERHRRAALAWINAVPELRPLAEALYTATTDDEAWLPYPDTPTVLAALAERGVPVGVVSNIAWDIRRHFAHYGLAGYVTAYALSYEHGLAKPDPMLFRRACQMLEVEPKRALMVGDNAEADGGAVRAGLRVFLLPTELTTGERGLDAVLRLVAR